MQTDAIAIRADGLTKRFGSVTAVQDLTFSVAAGRITGFLGPNGAGKTTTLRMVLGLARPTAGSSTIFGVPYAALDKPAEQVGASLEVCGFHPGRSGRDHLRSLAELAALPKSRVDETLALVELTGAADRRVKGYSMGMRQRLALASTLLGDPSVLILDEPANGLDPQGIRWLRDFLRGRAAEGRTVLVSSHVLSEVALTADEVIVIHHGRLIEQGPVSRLTGTRAVYVRTPHADVLAAALRKDGASVRAEGDGRLLVEDRSAEQVGELAFAAEVALHELTERTASLEDVFLQLTSDGAGIGS